MLIGPLPATTVTVVGPPLSGATTLAAALGRLLPGCVVQEGGGGRVGNGRLGVTAVVFVVSAAAPMTASDGALLDRVCRAPGTGTVVAAVSKIDVHRTWRAVLAANRADWPNRAVAWVGVAAAPDIGPPHLADLITALRTPAPIRRRPIPAGQPIRSRGALRQARVELTGQTRAMCAALRADLHQDVAAVSPRRAEQFRHDAHRRALQTVEAVDGLVAARLAEITAGPPIALPDLANPLAALPPARPADLENRLTALLGVGFGTGSAVTLDRVLAGTPGAAALSLAAGAGLGTWVVHTRRVLSVRAGLDRWVDEVSAALRPALEERVAARVIAAEIALGSPQADRTAERV